MLDAGLCLAVDRVVGFLFWCGRPVLPRPVRDQGRGAWVVAVGEGGRFLDGPVQAGLAVGMGVVTAVGGCPYGFGQAGTAGRGL